MRKEKTNTILFIKQFLAKYRFIVFKSTYILFAIILFTHSFQIYANQYDTLSITEKNWEKINKKADYNENFKETETRNINTNFSAHWIKSNIIKTISAVLIISLLLFFIYKLLKNNFFRINSKVKQNELYHIFNENEDINNLDFNLKLDEALLNKDYKLAIRIRFLQVIKQLSISEFIRWEKDKTNGDYINELSTMQELSDFNQLVLIYEKTWFGEILLKYEDYTILSSYFTSFTIKIEKNEQ